MKMKKSFKSEKGSITVFTLASCLFFLVSVIGVQAYTKNKEMAVEEDYKRIKQSYEKDIDNQAEIYNRIKDLTGDIGVNFEPQEDYLIPTGTTSCSISQKFTVDNQSNNRVQSLSFGWSTEPETQLINWENVSIQSLTHTANKTGATAGDYYLWVKVKHEGENEAASTRSNKITVYSDGITISNSSSNAVITYPVSVNLYNKRIGQGETEQEAKARLQNNTATTTAITSNVLYVEATDSHGNKIHKGYTPVEFATTNGRIDVVWVDLNNNVISSPLNVNNYLNGLTKTAWNSSNEEITPTSDSAWYNYTTGQNKWANAKNSDGSYFVWVPRYAYRITYLNDQNKPSGYFDGRGMVDLAGNPIFAESGDIFVPKSTNIIKNGKQMYIMATVLDDGVNVVEYNGYQYIVHPAFETDKNLGGWSTDLAGFWVAKFEMSREDYVTDTWSPHGTSDNGGGNILTTKASNTENDENNSETIRAVSKPDYKIWRSINIGNCYLNSYNYDRTKESHLMKNSEWGAIAYLTHSQYGLNANEIAPNSVGYLSKAGGLTTSSTSNMYGIFDLSGGAHEYLANFYKGGTELYLTDELYGLNMSKYAIKDNEYISTKYITLYQGNSSYSGNSVIYKFGKVGDATKEANLGGNDISSTNTFYKNWFNDRAEFVRTGGPFFIRGATYMSTDNAGVFSFSSYIGESNSAVTFRVVLCQ